MSPRRLIIVSMMLVAVQPTAPRAQFKARLPATPITPVWDKGIQPINRDSYWNAVACGKQGGQRPACVFYDGDLCTNGDFTLALFTPYKLVAYEAWQAARQKQEPPASSYGDAQRTRVTIGVTPVKGSTNPIVGLDVKRGARVIKPASQSSDGAGGLRFIFDFAAFAPSGDLTLELIGKNGTHTCLIEKAVLTQFR